MDEQLVEMKIKLERQSPPRHVTTALRSASPRHVTTAPRSASPRHVTTAPRSASPQLEECAVTHPAGDSSDHSCSDEEMEEDKPTVITHKEAMREFRQGLAELILGDNLLNDLPTSITLEEVNSLLAVEHGQAITVNVRRGDHSILPVVVVHNGSVLDLKKAIRRHVALKQEREGGTKHISWKYVWKTYWLYFQGQKMSDDHKKLKDYGIGNKDEVTFIKRLHAR